MNIVRLVFNPLQENTYVVWDETRECIIIDAGNCSDEENQRLATFITEQQLHPVMTINTHGHFDHILSVDTLRASAKAEGIDLKVYIHEGDAPMLTDGEKNGFTFFFGQDRVYAPADVLLRDGDEIPLGGGKVKVIHTPGHSPGSVCYLCVEPTGNARILVTGDTLFADNIGRWDLWGGSRDTLFRSLGLLRTLEGRLTIYPGHGDSAKLSLALDNVMYF